MASNATQRTGRHATHGECTDHPGPGFLARSVGVGRSRREAASRRPRRHGADAAGPRVEGRRPVGDHLRGPRRCDHRGGRGGRPAGRPRGPQRAGFSGYAASDRVPSGSPRWSTSTPRRGRAPLDAEHRRRREAVRLGRDQGGGEPRRPERGAARDVPRAGRAGTRRRAARRATTFTNDARRDIPSTVIATGYTAEAYQTYAKEHPDWAFLAGIPELRNVSWVDLPTSHWPMWSKPAELAKIIGDVATAAGDAR